MLTFHFLFLLDLDPFLIIHITVGAPVIHALIHIRSNLLPLAAFV